MSANESNSVDAFGVQAPSQPTFRVRSLAVRALLLAFAFIAALATIAVLIVATMSQMQWQDVPENLEYPRPRTTPLPASNRAVTPADVGDIDELPAPQQQYRPTVVPGASNVQPYTPSYGPSFTPSVPVTPQREPRPRPAPTSEAPAPEAAPPPPRASAAAPPARLAAGGFRRVAGKTFKQEEDGFLVDTSYDAAAGLQIVEVAAGSPECARLLDTHKNLAPYFRLSDRLLVVVDGVAYRVVP